MKKNYLRIETIRKDIVVAVALHLITDNVTGIIYDASSDESRVYFRNANPFTFIRIHLSIDELMGLINRGLARTVTREGSIFNYSIASF